MTLTRDRDGRTAPDPSPNVRDLMATLDLARRMIAQGTPREEAVRVLTDALRAIYGQRDERPVREWVP